MLQQKFQKALIPFCAAVTVALVSLEVRAHGDMDWNDFTIDSKNDSIETMIQHVQDVIADVTLARRPVPVWPDNELQQLRTELLHQQEELDDLLNHFNEAGIRYQVKRVLLEHPRAGRTVTGSHAVETAIALIDYMHSLDDHLAFEDELHEEGKGAYMYDLLESYRDRMEVYRELIRRTATPKQP